MFNGIMFFHSAAFGITAMLIVGASWCLIGLVMGNAPKQNIEPALVQLFSTLVSISVSLGIILLTDIPACSGKVLLLTCTSIALGGLLNFYMLRIMSYAMQRGPNGIIWAIIQSALVCPFIVGILFFKVKLTWLRGAGIIALLVALVLFAFTKNNTVQGKKWLLPTLLCFLLTGILHNLMTFPSYFPEANAVTSIIRTLASSTGSALGAFLWIAYRLFSGGMQQFRKNIRSPYLWKYVFALQFSGLLFSYTLQYPGMNVMALHGLGAMCYPVMVGSCIISFTVASVFLLKEKFSLMQGIALCFCSSGIALICTPA